MLHIKNLGLHLSFFQYESTEEADLTGAIADSTTFEAAKVIPGTMISNYKPVQWSNKYTGKK